MSLPKIEDITGGYKFSWNGTELVDIKVNRLRYSQGGDLTGELLVTTTAPGYSPHLHLGKLNFNSGPAREKLSNMLNKVYPIDWPAILECLCVYTLERYRRGEPVQEILADNERPDPPQYLLSPFLIENYPTVFFGDPSSFKSNTALIVATCVILPWINNPLKLREPRHPIPTLYLDWETDISTIKYQMGCLQRGMGLPSVPLSYRRCSLPLAGDLEQIQGAIFDTNAGLIIIDSLGLACGGELNEAGPAIAFFTAVRQLKVPSLILAHTSKSKESANKSVYGSVYFEAQARNIWQLRKRQDKDETALDLSLRNTKAPPFSKPHRDLGFHVDFGQDSMTVAPCDPKNVAEFLETMGTQDRILALLETDGPQTPKEVAEKLDITPENARNKLFVLKNKGEIVKSASTDKYGLVDKNHGAL